MSTVDSHWEVKVLTLPAEDIAIKQYTPYEVILLQGLIAVHISYSRLCDLPPYPIKDKREKMAAEMTWVH